MINFYDLTLNPEQFLKLFRSAAECKFDGTDLFLKNLSEKYKLACLTNTNPIQLPRIKNELGLGTFLADNTYHLRLGL